MNRNCCTNSVPYGYGGRRADTMVFPVRIIMSPTCSRTFFVGRNTLSAAALTTGSLPSCPEHYGMETGGAKGEPVVCSPRFGGEEIGDRIRRRHARSGRVRWFEDARRERAGGQLPARGGRR